MVDLAHDPSFMLDHSKTVSNADTSPISPHNVFHLQNRPRILHLYGKNLLRARNDSQKAMLRSYNKLSSTTHDYSGKLHNIQQTETSCSSEDSLINNGTITERSNYERTSKLLKKKCKKSQASPANPSDTPDNNNSRRPHSVDVPNRLSLSLNPSESSLSYSQSVAGQTADNTPDKLQTLQSCSSVPCVLAQVDTSGTAFQRYCLYRRSLSGIQYEQSTFAQRRARSVSKQAVNVRQHSSSPLVNTAHSTDLMTKSDYHLPCGTLSAAESRDVFPPSAGDHPSDMDGIPACMTSSDYGPVMMTRSETDETITGDVTPTSTNKALPGSHEPMRSHLLKSMNHKISIPNSVSMSCERTKSSSLYIKSSNSTTRLPKNRYSLYLGSESYIHSAHAAKLTNSVSGNFRPCQQPAVTNNRQQFATVKRSNSVPVKNDSSVIVKMDLKKNEIQSMSTEDYEKEQLTKERCNNKSLRNRTMSFFKPRSARTRSFDPHHSKPDERDKTVRDSNKRSKSPFFRLFSGGHAASVSHQDSSNSTTTEEEDSVRPGKSAPSLKVVMRRKSRSRDKKSESYQPQCDKRTSLDRLGSFFRNNSKPRFSQNDATDREESFLESFRESDSAVMTPALCHSHQDDKKDYASNLTCLLSLLEQRMSQNTDFVESTIPLSKMKFWLRTGKDKVKAKHRRLFDRYPADAQPANYSKVLCGLSISNSPVQDNPLEDESKLKRSDSLQKKSKCKTNLGLGGRMYSTDSSEVLSRSTAERLDILSSQYTAAVSLRRAYKDNRLKIERRTSSGHWTMSTASIRHHDSSSPQSVRSLSVGPNLSAKSIPHDSQQFKEINKLSHYREPDRSVLQRSSTLSTDSAVMSASLHSSITTGSYRTNSLITPMGSDTLSINSHPDDIGQLSNLWSSRPSSIVETTPLVQIRRPKLIHESNKLSSSYQKCSTETLKAGAIVSPHTAPVPPPRSVSLRHSSCEPSTPDAHNSSAMSSPTNKSNKPFMPPPNTPLSTPLQDYQSWCKRLPYKNSVSLTQSAKKVIKKNLIDGVSDDYISPRDLRKSETARDSNRKRCSLSMPMNAEKELDKMLSEKSIDPRPRTLYLCKTEVNPNDGENKLMTQSEISFTDSRTPTSCTSSPDDHDSEAQTPSNSIDILKSMTSTKMSIALCEGNGSLSSLQANLDSPSLGQYSRLYSLRGLSESRNQTSSPNSRRKLRPSKDGKSLQDSSSLSSQSPSPSSSQILSRRRHTATLMYSSMHSDAFSRSQRVLTEMKERHNKRNSMPIDETAILAVLNAIKKQSSQSSSVKSLDQQESTTKDRDNLHLGGVN